MVSKAQKLSIVFIYIFSAFILGYDSSISSSSFPHLSKKTETGTENQDKLNRDLMISTSLGSISGGIIFFVSKTERKRPFLIADFVIIIGVIFSSFSNGELGLCFGRFFVGTGVSILTLSSPLLVSETWPTGTGLLASVGFWYQTGQVAGDLLSWLTWRMLRLTMLVPVVTQLAIIGCTNKLAFHGAKESFFDSLTNSTFRRSVFSAVIVQLTPYAAGIKVVARVGPKSTPNFSVISAPVAVLGSILSVVFVKLLNLKKLLAFALLLISVELGIAALITSSPALKPWKVLLLSAYIGTFTGSLGTIPTLFAVKSFSTGCRGTGLGHVSILSSCFFLACNLILDQSDSLKNSDSLSLGLYAFFTLLFFFIVLCFVKNFETTEGGDEVNAETKNAEGNEMIQTPIPPV